MIAGAVEKNLGLVLEAAKSAGMDDPVTVTLIFGSPIGGRLGEFPSSCLGA
jgi:hypothetical protein